jgi:hypothetical protein
MTAEQFNEKYADFLEERHYGLDIDHEKVVAYLDDVFENELTKLPGFSYSQIKLKYSTSRFYANGVSSERETEIERKINELVKN